MKRKLIIIAAGITFLIAVSWIGGVLSNVVPRTPSARIQTAQAGLYQLTMQVDPNPPLLTQPAMVSVQVTRNQQPIADAHVLIEYEMQEMDMGTARVEAKDQSGGLYTASLQFSMSGPWRIHVYVTTPEQKSSSATFEITAQ